MRRTAILVLGVALVFTACDATTDTLSVWSSTTALSPSSATTSPPSFTTITSPPSPTSTFGGISVDVDGLERFRPSDVAPPLLVAHDDGIDLWTPHGVIPVLGGREVGVAYPDLAGGVVFSAWDEDGGNVIEWIPHLVDEPRILVADARWLHPTQVTWVEGRWVLVYRKIVELPNDCPPEHEPDCSWPYLREYLHIYDLETGADETLGGIGSFESDYIDVRFGGDWAAVTYEPYSAPWACSALIPARQLLDSWLDPPPFQTEILSDGTVVRACDPDGPDLGWATITTEGAYWMKVVGTWEFPEPWRLVGYDTNSSDEIFDIKLPEGMGAASWYDFDDTHIVLSTWYRTASPQQDEPVFLVDLDGTVTELDIEGRATIWSPPYAETPITLRSDGVGPVSLGDADEKVMLELTAMLGAPSWDSVIESAEWMGMHNGYTVDHYIRSVSWEHIGLGAIISDGVTWPDGRGGPVLTRWVYGTPGDDPSVRFLTAEGVGVGSTVEDLRTAYGERLSFNEDEFDGWRATLPEALPGAHPPLSGIVFDLTGDPSDPATTVGYMWAGAAQAP